MINLEQKSTFATQHYLQTLLSQRIKKLMTECQIIQILYQ